MADISVTLVPCLQDNYAYLITDGSGLCAVVDPSEPGPVKKALTERGLTLTHILNTHHHLDHCGGNLVLK
ncbi:MAG: MBL fold metallo-hydrolase [Rhizomicrobium sp.]